MNEIFASLSKQLLVFGTIVNTILLIAGAIIGLIIRTRLNENVTKAVFNAMGLFIVFLGIKMAFNVSNILIMIISIFIGTIIGELLKLEQNLEKSVNKLKHLPHPLMKKINAQFIEGLLTTFIMFCTGTMVIIGTFEEGVQHNPSVLLAKSIIDGFASIALASTFGIGVLFAAIPLFFYQSSLTLLAFFIGNNINQTVMLAVSTTGGLLLVGLGLNVLKFTKLHLFNMAPSLILAGILASLFK